MCAYLKKNEIKMKRQGESIQIMIFKESLRLKLNKVNRTVGYFELIRVCRKRHLNRVKK